MQNFLARLFEPKTNSPEITFLLTQLIGVNISKTTIQYELEVHPNFPSLLSISDLLKKYGVDNLSIKIDNSKLAEVPLPFVTQITGVLDNQTKFFTIVKQITQDGLYFFDPEKSRWVFSSFEAFLIRFSGIILLTEVTGNAGEKAYVEFVKKEKYTLVRQTVTALWLPLIFVVLVLISMKMNGATILPGLFSVLTLAGALTGILLLWYELDQDNPLLRQICSSGKKVNCGAVLKSRASKIFGVSWSTIGASYFIGNLLIMLFWGVTNPTALFSVAILNGFAVPYVIYSVYYQAHVAKQWCFLCLTVQLILILQLTIALFGKWHTLVPIEAISVQLILQSLAAVSIPFVLISVLFPTLQKAKDGANYWRVLHQLKNDPQIFKTLLAKEKAVSLENVDFSIQLGNPKAKYKILKVCSPYCGPCGRAHESLENLMNHNSDVGVEIIFHASDNNADARTKPVRHLLAIDQLGKNGDIKSALDDWYSQQKDYDAFALRFPVNGQLNQQGERIKKMENWCLKAKINYTPTIFISMPGLGGDVTMFYELPSTYNIEDLKYFLAANLE